MINLSREQKYFFIFLCLHVVNESKAQQGFVMNFQMVKNHSQLTTDAFAEFTGAVHAVFSVSVQHIVLGKIEETVTTFTACWWFNIQYFSSSSNTVWQYCFVRKKGDPQTCTSFGNQIVLLVHIIWLQFESFSTSLFLPLKQHYLF